MHIDVCGRAHREKRWTVVLVGGTPRLAFVSHRINLILTYRCQVTTCSPCAPPIDRYYGWLLFVSSSTSPGVHPVLIGGFHESEIFRSKRYRAGASPTATSPKLPCHMRVCGGPEFGKSPAIGWANSVSSDLDGRAQNVDLERPLSEAEEVLGSACRTYHELTHKEDMTTKPPPLRASYRATPYTAQYTYCSKSS